MRGICTMAIQVGDYILTTFHKEKEFQVMKKGVGYKKDCFETDIHEMYFLDNRFKSWSKVKKRKKEWD